MTVVTTRKRIYSFILRTSSGHDRRVVFKVRFTYPDEEADARLMEKARELAAFPNKRNAERSSIRNFDYSYKGSATVKPEYVFDDGTKTYFRFSGDVPGIFFVNPDRSETLINYRREGEMIVVDRTAGQWTMRNGRRDGLRLQYARRSGAATDGARDGRPTRDPGRACAGRRAS